MKEKKLTRLKEYNYSQSGYYFVTVCTENKEEWFGRIEDGRMVLNNYGEIAKDFWSEIPLHFEHVKIDEFKIMPNHVHGILIIEDNRVGNAYMRSDQRNAFMHSL
jgi:putative transposase